MKSAIILLAIALVVRADMIITSEGQAALTQLLEQLASNEITPVAGEYTRLMQEVRKTPTTDSVIAWTDTGLNGCQTLSSNLSAYCGITYQSPAIAIRRFAPAIESLIGPMNNNNLTTPDCKDAIKEILCKGFFPQCSSNASTATYRTFTSACNTIASCDNSVININGIGSATLCANNGQTVNLKSCVKFTSNNPSTTGGPCGSLPVNITFPALAVDEVARDRAFLNTLNVILSPQLGVSERCRRLWFEFICIKVPYCSPDQSSFLSAVTRQQCLSAMDCLPSLIKNNFAVLYDCSTYPDEGSRTMCVNPSQGYGQRKEVNSTVMCGQGTTVVPTVASVASTTAPNTTTMATNRASALSIGSAIFYFVCMLLAYFH